MSEALRQPEEEPQLTPENPEAKTEGELSPEVIEKIMAKVQDIDSPGIGYSFFSKNCESNNEAEGLLSGVLENGLLGLKASKEKDQKSIWRKVVREGRNAKTYFNITGRSHAKDRAMEVGVFETEISASTWSTQQDYMVSGVIFDISRFDELDPLEETSGRRENKTFKVEIGGSVDTDPEAYNKWRAEGFKPEDMDEYNAVDSEFGYTLTHRVAPRFFRGILISDPKQAHWKNRFRGIMPFKDKDRDTKIHNIAQETAEVMREACKDKPDSLLPIYDTKGNLLWPKQMDYNEVRKFIKERGAEKQEK